MDIDVTLYFQLQVADRFALYISYRNAYHSAQFNESFNCQAKIQLRIIRTMLLWSINIHVLSNLIMILICRSAD